MKKLYRDSWNKRESSATVKATGARKIRERKHVERKLKKHGDASPDTTSSDKSDDLISREDILYLSSVRSSYSDGE